MVIQSLVSLALAAGEWVWMPDAGRAGWEVDPPARVMGHFKNKVGAEVLVGEEPVASRSVLASAPAKEPRHPLTVPDGGKGRRRVALKNKVGAEVVVGAEPVTGWLAPASAPPKVQASRLGSAKHPVLGTVIGGRRIIHTRKMVGAEVLVGEKPVARRAVLASAPPKESVTWTPAGGAPKLLSFHEPDLPPWTELGPLFFTDTCNEEYAARPLTELTRASEELLPEIAEWIQRHPGLVIEVGGHCDEKGTNNYNLTPAMLRAVYIKQRLVALGVNEDRLVTLGYGEDVPLCYESNAACWARNNRVDFMILRKK